MQHTSRAAAAAATAALIKHNEQLKTFSNLRTVKKGGKGREKVAECAQEREKEIKRSRATCSAPGVEHQHESWLQ